MKQQPLNTFVDFVGDFPKPTSIDDTSGKELADFLAAGLTERGFNVTEVIDGGCGYQVTCKDERCQYEATAGVDDFVDMRRWIIITNFETPFADRLLRRPWPAGFEQFLLAIDDILRTSDRVTEIRWFPHFEASEYLDVHPASEGPHPDPPSDAQLPFAIRLDDFLERMSGSLFSPLACFVAFASGIGLALVFPEAVVTTTLLVYFVALFLINIVIPGFIAAHIRRTARKRRE